ncbi:MAG: hypothetical protein HY901_21995 [Deltaproteobacteria bacterium]|nr:hypothetical protein [Deltaproteobacteria bacterium]
MELERPAQFVHRHHELLQVGAQSLASPGDAPALRAGCCQLMASALHLGRSTGVMDAQALVERWISVAKQHGAAE